VSEEMAKVLARLLAWMYDRGEGGAVKIATRSGGKKKESPRGRIGKTQQGGSTSWR